MTMLTFLNKTDYPAQFLVKKGEQVVARLPAIAPQAVMQVPSTDDYQVTATTIIENNTYTSAPIQVTGASGFLAQVMQDSLRGTYDFQMVAGPSTAADRMVFQKTTLGPVTFNIWKNGRIMQSVVVPDSFLTRSVQIGSVFTIYAVINGVTTALVTTGNPEATITAVTDTSDLEAGYFTLLAN
ncbi:MAG TPA: hypothetical protein VF457_00350 [Burkholderiaceae bacterium]